MYHIATTFSPFFIFLTGIPIVPFVLMGIFAVAIITIAIVAYSSAKKRYMEIEKNGLYADSVVVSSKYRYVDGRKRYTTTIRFTGNDGKTHDCDLDYRGKLPIGRRVRIQYLPYKFDHVIFISQDLNTPAGNTSMEDEL